MRTPPAPLYTCFHMIDAKPLIVPLVHLPPRSPTSFGLSPVRTGGRPTPEGVSTDLRIYGSRLEPLGCVLTVMLRSLENAAARLAASFSISAVESCRGSSLVFYYAAENCIQPRWPAALQLRWQLNQRACLGYTCVNDKDPYAI